MQFATRLFATTVLASLASAAMALDAEQSSSWMTPSTKTRAEVMAEMQSAVRSGALPHNEASYTVVASSSSSALTRTQVAAEAREAQRLGLTAVNDADVPVASAAQREQVRLAGLRAISTDSQLAAK
ncbi:MAG: DUF4148 domain-containing protein [Piscinibacter sp.]